MVKFHLPRMLYGLDRCQHFVEVVREEKYSRAPQSFKHFVRHFYPSPTDNLEEFSENHKLVVYGAVIAVIRKVAILEIGRLGKITILFEDGELVEGVES